MADREAGWQSDERLGAGESGRWWFWKRGPATKRRTRQTAALEPPAEVLRPVLEGIERRAGEITLSIAAARDGDPGRPAEEPQGVARLMLGLFQAAIQAGASDLYLEPGSRALRVRARLDGELHETAQLPLSLHEALILT